MKDSSHPAEEKSNRQRGEGKSEAETTNLFNELNPDRVDSSLQAAKERPLFRMAGDIGDIKEPT